MIRSTFHEETKFLNVSNLNSLKRYYITFYWKVRKGSIDYMHDSISHDSLIGLIIIIRSKKCVSCESQMSSPSVLSHDTKASKVSDKDKPSGFTLRTSITHFYLNLTLKGMRTIL
jgi:hypothetical protein